MEVESEWNLRSRESQMRSNLLGGVKCQMKNSADDEEDEEKDEAQKKKNDESEEKMITKKKKIKED